MVEFIENCIPYIYYVIIIYYIMYYIRWIPFLKMSNQVSVDFVSRKAIKKFLIIKMYLLKVQNMLGKHKFKRGFALKHMIILFDFWESQRIYNNDMHLRRVIQHIDSMTKHIKQYYFDADQYIK